MAVDEHRVREGMTRRFQQVGKGAVIRQIELVDAPHGVRESELTTVYFRAARDDAGDGSEASGHSIGSCVHIVRQLFLEHRRVELPGFPVDVQIGAREVRAYQRNAMGRRISEQFIDETVLGLSQTVGVEARCREKIVRVVGTAVG